MIEKTKKNPIKLTENATVQIKKLMTDKAK